jgi:NTE family protein
MTRRSLILGGGGVAGIAWEVGVLSGLARGGVDVTERCDDIIGTSAGACVGAYVAAGTSFDDMVARQRLPSSDTREFVPDFDLSLVIEIFGLVTTASTDAVAARRTVGSLARDAARVSESVRRDVVVWRLGTDRWPARPLTVTAVDIASGERVCFSASSGVGLVDAVSASCAVPGIWPPVTIGERRFMDGGVYSPTNADLVTNGRALVIGPTPERATVDPAHSARLVIVADEASESAFGANRLDPATRPAAVAAGMAQGERLAHDVAAFWHAD